jgi:hypothetical protein
MRCRECLIAFVRSVAEPGMVPAGQEPPKLADVTAVLIIGDANKSATIHWTELIAGTVSPGPKAADIPRRAARRCSGPRSTTTNTERASPVSLPSSVSMRILGTEWKLVVSVRRSADSSRHQQGAVQVAITAANPAFP